MREAADQADLDPDRISFIRTLRIVRRQVSGQLAYSPRRLTAATREAIEGILERSMPERRGALLSAQAEKSTAQFILCEAGR